MAANSKPEEFKGANKNKWILGNRFVHQEVKGEMMGQPFQGLGITGYDNMKGQYTSVWLDNMGTGMMTAAANYDMAAKIFSEEGAFSCPLTMEISYERVK